MPINRDKPDLWKDDVNTSVDFFNGWFLEFAPVTYRETRIKTTAQVKRALVLTEDLNRVTPAAIAAHPEILPILRMATAPPIARDRLTGLAGVKKSLVGSLEEGKLPSRMRKRELESSLNLICGIIGKILDKDIFSWVDGGTTPTDHERERASTIVADRLCGAVANPIIRNAQERRQLETIGAFLNRLGYRKTDNVPGDAITTMRAGTYSVHQNVLNTGETTVTIPVDVAIQPKEPRSNNVPIFIEAKSAGDFTNTNKRRKEEATKVRQLRETYGEDTQLILFLCGYFGPDYLGYEASEGLDWVWEHRIEDLLQLGL